MVVHYYTWYILITWPECSNVLMCLSQQAARNTRTQSNRLASYGETSDVCFIEYVFENELPMH